MTDNLSALLEAIVYLSDEPVRLDQIRKALPEVDRDELASRMDALVERYKSEDHGIEIREVADGYRFATKPEHHEILRKFAKSLVPPTRLSLAALETLAVIAYRQPITIPEIQEIRGVQASGVIKTLLDRKLVTAAGRKEVVGRPILYKTTRSFLMHFGLRNLDELPSMEEFEEIIKSEHADQAVLEMDEDDPDSGEPSSASDLIDDAGSAGSDAAAQASDPGAAAGRDGSGGGPVGHPDRDGSDDDGGGEEDAPGGEDSDAGANDDAADSDGDSASDNSDNDVDDELEDDDEYDDDDGDDDDDEDEDDDDEDDEDDDDAGEDPDDDDDEADADEIDDDNR